MRTCEDCEHFKFFPAMGPVEGWCEAIPGDMPEAPGKVVRFNTDATKCPKFEPMKAKDAQFMTQLDKTHYNRDQRYGKEALERPKYTKLDAREVGQRIDDYITKKRPEDEAGKEAKP